MLLALKIEALSSEFGCSRWPPVGLVMLKHNLRLVMLKHNLRL